MSQPYISQQIRDLERARELPLIVQHGCSLAMTASGAELGAIEHRLVVSWRLAVKRAAEHAAGTAWHLAIGASMTTGVYVLPSVLAELRVERPGVTKPVMRANTRKFMAECSAEDLRIFESVAGRSLDVLQYERTVVEPGRELRFTPAQIAAFEEVNRRLKERAWSELPADDRERRARQSALLREIAQRHAERAAASAPSAAVTA